MSRRSRRKMLSKARLKPLAGLKPGSLSRTLRRLSGRPQQAAGKVELMFGLRRIRRRVAVRRASRLAFTGLFGLSIVLLFVLAAALRH